MSAPHDEENRDIDKAAAVLLLGPAIGALIWLILLGLAWLLRCVVWG